jgi:hypothetical protein
MPKKKLAGAFRPVLSLAALVVCVDPASAADDSKYPDWRGQWTGVLRRVQGLPGQPSFDPSKPWGLGQGAPLNPEYQAVLEANLKAQTQGAPGNITGPGCLGFGMPVITYGFEPMEFIITPEVTYVLINWVEHTRRIYTDARDWPADIADVEPTMVGYSIGRWIDEDGDGRYDVLEVETRGPFRGPRYYDAAGLPLHHDNQSIFKERIHLDNTDQSILHDELTVYDHALTRPWSITRDLRRTPNPRPEWREFNCAQNNPYVAIGKETYFLSAGSLLMPMRKGQPAPDLRYFK